MAKAEDCYNWTALQVLQQRCAEVSVGESSWIRGSEAAAHTGDEVESVCVIAGRGCSLVNDCRKMGGSKLKSLNF